MCFRLQTPQISYTKDYGCSDFHFASIISTNGKFSAANRHIYRQIDFLTIFRLPKMWERKRQLPPWRRPAPPTGPRWLATHDGARE